MLQKSEKSLQGDQQGQIFDPMDDILFNGKDKNIGPFLPPHNGPGKPE